jgi:RNA polymerase sigma-70 factor (ECF subfamily)
MPADLRDDIIALLPDLRAFSGSLAGDPFLADDLVQETLVKAWSRFEGFRLGSNLRAWLFTILRNEFYTHHRRRRREVLDGGEFVIASTPSQGGQGDHMEMADLRRALACLGEEQREALILSAAAGFSYEEVAQICGCAMGTVKSRINRARKRILELLANGGVAETSVVLPALNAMDDRTPGQAAPPSGAGNESLPGGRRQQLGDGLGKYRCPDEICGAADLDWGQKLRLLNGWRLQVRRDMEAGGFDQACGKALLCELHLALRHVAASVFREATPGA